MALIDLRNYVVMSKSTGYWLDATFLGEHNMSLADTFSPSRLVLRWTNDTVVLTGNVRVRVSFQSENVTYAASVMTTTGWPASTAENPPEWGDVVPTSDTGGTISGFGAVHANTMYSYTLEVPPGQVWPFVLREQEVFHRLGNNFGFRVVIEPAFDAPVATQPLGDLPCDFAAVNQPNTAQFFPAACEPCPPGTSIGLPPGGPSLGIPVAEGGCIRPRYFNGMFITKEDLESDQRYFRLKARLHNRAGGQGVVWGLNVGKAGNQVCVLPGYGVDCCGNDLALTSVYKVDIATLLRDPAAQAALSTPVFTFVPQLINEAVIVDGSGMMARAAGGAASPYMDSYVARGTAGRTSRFAGFANAGSFSSANGPGPNVQSGVRMHLLLEYVECPSDPRPVHADPCAGTASRCEMSRIRESVRLRLVPPRDISTAGPIQTFLNKVKQLRGSLPDYTDPSIGAADPMAPWKFNFRFLCVGTAGCREDSPYDPFSPDSATEVRFTPPAGSTFSQFTIEMEMEGANLFTDGQVTLVPTVGAKIDGDADLRPIGLEFDRPKAVFTVGATRTEYTYSVVGWRAQSIFAPATADVSAGSISLNVKVQADEILITRGASTFNVVPSGVTDPVCAGEPCLPLGAAPVLPNFPWLHPDAVDTHCNGSAIDKPGAGDPKVLILAALGGWLTKLLVEHQKGTANEEWSSRRILATGLYEGVWRLFYGIEQGPTKANVQDALRKLFRDWCDAFMYKGPVCEGEPHGVVIGCTLVSGGTIGEIDPYGGRRWVMRYPLIAHWTQQMGMAPFDVMASRMLSSLCCVAALPSIGALEQLPTMVLELGGCLLTFGPIEETTRRAHDEWGLNVNATNEVGFVEFVAKFIEAIGKDSIQKPPTGSDPIDATRFTLNSFAQPCALSIVCANGEAVNGGGTRARTAPAAQPAPTVTGTVLLVRTPDPNTGGNP